MKRAHIKVYVRLRNMIDEGVFPVGSALPAEPKLAQMLDTCRMTLRRALVLLEEDGLLEKIQGSGNYVKAANDAAKPGLNQLGNPISKCLQTPWDQIDSEYEIEEAQDEYSINLFGEAGCRYVSSYQYYYCKEKLVAYTYSAIAVKYLEEQGISPEDSEARQKFLTEGIYEIAKRAHIEILPDLNAGSLWPAELSEEERVTYMIENIYSDDFRLLLCNKHYFLGGSCRIVIDSEHA